MITYRIIFAILLITGPIVIPLQLVTTFILGILVSLTFGLLLMPINVIWIVLFYGPLLGLSYVYERVVILRPFVSIVGIPLAVLANTYVALMPSMGDMDGRFLKLILCETFPYTWKFLQFQKGKVNIGKDDVLDRILKEISKAPNLGKYLDGLRADVNASGVTPLHWAATKGHADVVESLIASGADVNAVYEDGWTPLYFAAAEGHADVVESLIASGADVNAVDDAGWTPLHLAAMKGHAEVAESLIAKGSDVNARTYAGWTPLYIAAAEGHAEAVESLIAKGADVNARTDNGATPLRMAAESGHKDIVELLRRHAAKE